MKKIGLLSDTHGYLDDRILHHLSNCDEIWHAGDIGNLDVTDKLGAFKPLKTVYGNIDDAKTRTVYPELLVWKVEGLKILLIHIAGSFGKYTSQVAGLLKAYKPDLLICGHSHILKVAKDKRFNVLYLNPGAAGKHGFHQIRTMLRFELDQGKIQNAEVIELGIRNELN